MKRTMSIKGLVAGGVWFTLAACTGSVFADGLRNPPPSAEGLALVGARYTLIDDATASAYNPANLTGVENGDIVVSLTSARSEKEFTDALGQSARVKEEWYLMPDLYTAYRLKDSTAVLGLSVSTPYGQATEFKKDSSLRYTSPYRAEIRTINVSPTVAWPVGDALKIGVGLDLMWSDIDIQQVFPWASVVGNPLVPDGALRFEGDGVGVGGHLGITWQVTARQRLALVYRSAVDVEYDGTTRVEGAPLGVPFAPESDFSTEVKYPNVVGLGYAIQVTDKWSVGAEVEWFDWSRYQELVLDAGANSALLPNAAIPQLWDDTWNIGLGTAYTLNESWTLRAGYIYLETPIPDQTMVPLLAENDQHVITAGVGYQRGAHRVDVSYGVGIYDDRDISNHLNPAFNGSYEFASQLAAVSYGLTF